MGIVKKILSEQLSSESSSINAHKFALLGIHSRAYNYHREDNQYQQYQDVPIDNQEERIP